MKRLWKVFSLLLFLWEIIRNFEIIKQIEIATKACHISVAYDKSRPKPFV